MKTQTGYTIEKIKEQFKSGMVMHNSKTGQDTVYRWDSNGQIPFSDMLNDFCELGLITQAVVDKSIEVRAIETAQFLESYKKAQTLRTADQIAEEGFEARAAHGAGVELVNVFTGERYTTQYIVREDSIGPPGPMFIYNTPLEGVCQTLYSLYSYGRTSEDITDHRDLMFSRMAGMVVP